MKFRKILPILILALFVSTTADAQRRRGRKKKVEEVEETAQQKLYKTMLPSTQQIMFVDSVDATKDDFMKHIKLSHDIGSIVTYDEFFNKKDSSGCYGFINGFGNKCFFSVPDKKKGSRLFTADKLDNKWKNETEINEMGEFVDSINHPYVLPDGLTLYFSAKSQERSLGGYDIFVTRFDSESGTFLEPENVGMPFNSPANDYMFVIDDVNNVGWFVTDRNKKNGHVTVYTFVPNDIRTNYDIEALGEEKVASYARIDSYRQTWTSKAERNEVMKKVQAINSDDVREKKDNVMNFAINDRVVYHSPENFRSRSARVLYDKMVQYENHLVAIEKELAEKRIRYHVSPESARSKMAPGMLKAEKEYETLLEEVVLMRKKIINEENETLNKKG